MYAMTMYIFATHMIMCHDFFSKTHLHSFLRPIHIFVMTLLYVCHMYVMTHQ